MHGVRLTAARPASPVERLLRVCTILRTFDWVAAQAQLAASERREPEHRACAHGDNCARSVGARPAVASLPRQLSASDRLAAMTAGYHQSRKPPCLRRNLRVSALGACHWKVNGRSVDPPRT
jgi:hypothetical protein